MSTEDAAATSAAVIDSNTSPAVVDSNTSSAVVDSNTSPAVVEVSIHDEDVHHHDTPKNEDGEDDEDDDDLVMDSADLERLHEMNHTKFDNVDFDLTAEYERPSMAVALENRKFHMPTRRNGTLYPIWATKTGRFDNKRICCIDCCCQGHRSELIAFGSGISAYFKLLKSMMILFFLLSVMAFPLLYINIHGGNYFANHPMAVTTTTLGNLYAGVTVVNGETVFANNTLLPLMFPSSVCGNGGVCPFNPNDVLLLYCVWDGVLMLVFFAAINILHRFTVNESNVYKRKVPKIEDFSVQISVPLGATPESIRTHFEANEQFPKGIKVHDVQIVESTGNSISICVRRGILLKRFARIDATVQEMQRSSSSTEQTAQAIQRYMKQMDKIKARIAHLDDLAVHRVEKQNGKQALMGFVTFDTQAAKIRMLNEYDGNNDSMCYGQPKWLRYLGKHVLKVKPASAPSTILWENQEVKYTCLRYSLAAIIIVLILLITVGLTFVSDQNRTISTAILSMGSTPTLPSSQFCEGRYAGFTTIEEQTEASRAMQDRACYCDNLEVNPLPAITDGDKHAVNTLCTDYWNQIYADMAKQAGISFLIVLINTLIYKVVMLVSVHLVKFPNVLHREQSVMRVIFIITFINTALIILLVNVDWEGLSGENFIPDISYADAGLVLIRAGSFVDFEPDWYSEVGVELFILAVLNIFAPYLLPVARYVYHIAEQRFAAKNAVSQQVLNDLFLGEEFLLSVRLAQMLTMVFFTLTYASGVPLLYSTAFVSFVVAYWFDKFFFLRLARTPPQFDTALQLWALRTLEWAIIGHCLLGFWMYSSPRLFPNESFGGFMIFQTGYGEMYTISTNETTMVWSLELGIRLERSGPLILLFVGAFVAGWKIVRRFGKAILSGCASCIAPCVRCCCQFSTHVDRGVTKRVLKAERFGVLLEKGRVAGVPSYNILANPVYQTMFQMQQGMAQDIHSLQDALHIRKGDSLLHGSTKTKHQHSSAVVVAAEDAPA